MTSLEDQFSQMVETVDGFFGRDQTPNQARKTFLKYRDESLQSVPSLDPALLRELPYYAALGFLGRVQFVDCPALDQFKAKPSQESLTKLRAAKALRMPPSADESWNFLSASHPEAALPVISLCAMGIRNKVIENALQPFQQVVKLPTP